MKQIRLKCLRDGNVQLYENTLIFNAENQATEFVVDYSGTTAEGLFKHVEILVGTDKTTRIFSLGQDDIVSFVIEQDITKAGYIYIQPYATFTVSEEDFTKIYFHKSQISVRSSINALHTDTSFTPSIAEQFQIELDLVSLGLSELQTQVNELSASDIQYGDGTVEDALLGITQNLVDLEDEKMDIDGLNSLVKKLRFDTADVQALVNIGDIHWSQDSRTLELKVSNDVAISLGQEEVLRVQNNESSIILNGKAVYISGTTGVNARVKLATNTIPDIAQRTIGLATEDLTVNEQGFICVQGIVNGINTSMFNGGDLLYLGTNGNLTNIEPTGDAIVVFIGVVLRSHVNQGRIYVSPKCVPTLDRLSRVSITSKVDNQVLVSQGEQWVNVNLDKNAVGLSNVDNTSDLDKPISTATQSALNGKANSVHTHVKSDITDFAHTHPISEVVNLQTALDGKVDKLYATNLVTNGDFSTSDLSWWTANQGFIVDNGTLYRNNTTGNSQRIQKDIVGIVGDKYYFRVNIIEFNTTFPFRINNGGDTFTYGVYGGNQVGQHSGVLTMTSSLLLRFMFWADTNTFNRIDNFLILNLTALFGAGNEPTKEQMDYLLSNFPNSWFNGTQELINYKQLLDRVLELDNAKANRVQEAWITPTLLNSWIDNSGFVSRYKKDEMGVVWVELFVNSGVQGSVIFALPSGYRPTQTLDITGNASSVLSRITILTNGNITHSIGTTSSLHRYVFSFRTD